MKLSSSNLVIHHSAVPWRPRKTLSLLADLHFFSSSLFVSLRSGLWGASIKSEGVKLNKCWQIVSNTKCLQELFGLFWFYLDPLGAQWICCWWQTCQHLVVISQISVRPWCGLVTFVYVYYNKTCALSFTFTANSTPESCCECVSLKRCPFKWLIVALKSQEFCLCFS